MLADESGEEVGLWTVLGQLEEVWSQYALDAHVGIGVDKSQLS